MEGLAILAAPFLAGLTLTLLLRINTPRGATWAAWVGVGLAACAALLVGFLVPNTFPDNSGEPFFTPRVWDELLVGFFFVLWLVGVGAGAVLCRRLRSDPPSA